MWVLGQVGLNSHTLSQEKREGGNMRGGIVCFSLVLRQSLELETTLPLRLLGAWTPGMSLLTFLAFHCCLQSPETARIPSSFSTSALARMSWLR